MTLIFLIKSEQGFGSPVFILIDFFFGSARQEKAWHNVNVQTTINTLSIVLYVRSGSLPSLFPLLLRTAQYMHGTVDYREVFPSHSRAAYE